AACAAVGWRPVLVDRLAFVLLGGEYPAPDMLSRLFVLHVLIVPAAIVLLLTVHMAILWRQQHTEYPGRGRSERTITGLRLWPRYTATSAGFLTIAIAVIVLLGALVQINPIWLYGPYDPTLVTTAAQPDW